MLFNSLEFFVFLIAVFGLYWLPVRKNWWQNAVVVGASLFFYAYWDWRVLGLFVGSILFTMFVARRIAKLHENRGGAKKWLVMAIALLLGVLGVFKYYNFFAETFAKMFGFASDSLTLSLILPLGISFYTFMCISYLVDTYKGIIPPSLNTHHSYLNTFTYLTFFPQIASGPIGRGPVMLPQFAAPRTFDYALAVEGCRQMLWGFFKKILVADTCSIVVVEMMKSTQESSIGIWVGAIVYTIQIYADFSGYSDMAIGCGKLFGIRLMRNFAYPYFATNIGDFWRRWHMTLTRWFTDYVYIPLGGSRCSKPRQIFNTLVVFLTSGLWHGAAWNFVAWGGAHGAFFIPKILTQKKTTHHCTPTPSTLTSIARWALLMFCVTLGWVLFQAPDFATAGHWFSMMFYKLNFSLKGAGLATCGLEKAILFSVLMFAWEWVSREQEVVKMPRSTVLRYAVYLALPLLIFLFYPQANNFIYFQF